MSTGLLMDCDDLVAKYLFNLFGWKPFKYDNAIGLLVNGQLQGAIIFHCYNGSNVELSYYGKGTATVGIARTLARFAIVHYDPSRVTIITSKRNKRYIQGFKKLGFQLEGTQRCFYGQKDCNRNTGVRLVMFRERINAIAKVHKSANVSSPRVLPLRHVNGRAEHPNAGQPAE
jgi:RimJ/RimL family protein N-acetyltransferase